MKNSLTYSFTITLFAGLLSFSGCSEKKANDLDDKATSANVQVQNSAQDKWEVPANPYLYPNSSQPIIHFNSAQSDVNVFEMPKGDIKVAPNQVKFLPAHVAIPGSAHKNYDDGSGAIIVSTNTSVMKVRFDGGRFEKIDELLIPGFGQDNASADVVKKLVDDMDAAYGNDEDILEIFGEYMDKYNLDGKVAPYGLYTFLDNNGDYYAGYGTSVYKIVDSAPEKSAASKLTIAAAVDVRSFLEPEVRKTVNRFMGFNVTYDGQLVIGLPGMIGVIDRDFTTLHTALIEGEFVDNGVAIDPDGGIYVVTSEYMRKLVWTGDKLSMDEKDGAWKEAYDYAKDKEGFWFSRGAGATPALMGFGEGNDKLVFIPDAGDPVKLNAYWRDEIPEDAKLLPGAKSKRLAASLPIEFPVITTVEWSPHVYKNGVFTFASDFPEPESDGAKTLFKTLVTMGYTRQAPVGAEKFTWNEETNTLEKSWNYIDKGITWTLSPVSGPNNAVYLNTLEDGKWVIKGFDWDSGENISNLHLPDSYIYNCAGGFIYPLPDTRIFVGGMFGPALIDLSIPPKY